MTNDKQPYPVAAPSVRAFLARIGSKGGSAGRGASKARPVAQLRRAQRASVAARRANKEQQQRQGNPPAADAAGK